MWPAIASFLLGIVGWVVVSFVGTPFLDFKKLRAQVHEEVIFTANIGVMVAEKPEHAKAVESLRRLGAKVQATNASAWRPLRWFIGRLGYDLVKAGRSLIALSSSLAKTPDIRRPHTEFDLEELETAAAGIKGRPADQAWPALALRTASRILRYRTALSSS